MAELIPTLLVESEREFEHRLRLVEPHVKTVQVDVLDGSKFGQTAWHDARSVGGMRTNIAFELHLMVENPLAVVEAWKEHVPTLTRAIFHVELDRQHKSIIEKIRETGLEVGIALNPETPIDEAHHDLGFLDELLLMTVHPGASGQGIGDPLHGLDEGTLLEKARAIHTKYPHLILGADGGMNETTLPEFLAAGVSRFYVGSAVFSAKEPEKALQQLNHILAGSSS